MKRLTEKVGQPGMVVEPSQQGRHEEAFLADWVCDDCQVCNR